MITLDNISLRRGSKLLLDGVNARIHSGQKVALIGANGVGKSSLFQLLLNSTMADKGTLDYPEDWRVSHMAQEVAASDRSAVDYVIDGDVELRKVERAVAAAEVTGDDSKLALLHQKLDEMNGYTAQIRAEILLHGLGFTGDEVHRPVREFSGGWRIRLNLAQALMCPSDLLLLDEPTNHLDMDATVWLEDWLRQYPGTLLLISHDREFIDGVCQQILHIEHGKLWTYRGNYSAFERQRAERMAREQADYARQQRRIEEIHRFVSRFRAKATKAKQAQSRLKELERMELLEPAHVDSPFDFSFPEPERVCDPLLGLSDAQLGYGDTAVLRHVNLSIHPGSRIGLLGLNGAGKSTLIRSLAGELPLVSGERIEGTHLNIGYFSQHQVDTLDLQASPVVMLQRVFPLATEQSIRDFLGSFNFRGDMATEEIARFSGGEKARLALALIVWRKPNLLLLDEPTNHLDLDMRHALTAALRSYEGGVVLVSHDRHLVRNTVDELILVNDGCVAPYDGDMNDYGQWLLATLKEVKVGPVSSEVEVAKAGKKQTRQQKAEVRRQLAPYRKRVKDLETEIEKLGSALAEIDLRLSDSALYAAEEKETLQTLLVKQGRIAQEKAAAEVEWLEHLERLEKLEAEALG